MLLAWLLAVPLGAQTTAATAPPGTLPAGIVFAAPPAQAAGPTLLAAGIEHEWGGHSFSYLLAGEHALFWTGVDHRGENEVGAPLIGRHAKSGAAAADQRTALALNVPGLSRTNPPLLARTPDGHLHLFAGYYGEDAQQGRVRYFRSERPEDASAFVDLGDLPTGSYAGFRLRHNIALSRTGDRLVHLVLSSFAEGRHPINTPLLQVGRRDGLDFAFDAPLAIEEPVPFFYPLVAATDHGIVAVGGVSDAADERRNAELLHCDGSGRPLYRTAFPLPDEPGDYSGHAMQPLRSDDWTKFAIARTLAPQHGSVRHLEFWTYDASERELRLRRSIRNDASMELSVTNAGELLALRDRPMLFVNNAASGSIWAWHGDLLDEGVLTIHRLAGTDPGEHGFARGRSVFVPNPLHGSVVDPGILWIATDCADRAMRPGDRGPCALLLFRCALAASATRR